MLNPHRHRGNRETPLTKPQPSCCETAASNCCPTSCSSEIVFNDFSPIYIFRPMSWVTINSTYLLLLWHPWQIVEPILAIIRIKERKQTTWHGKGTNAAGSADQWITLIQAQQIFELLARMIWNRWSFKLGCYCVEPWVVIPLMDIIILLRRTWIKQTKTRIVWAAAF